MRARIRSMVAVSVDLCGHHGGLFTGVRGIGILRTSPFGHSPKFALKEFCELRDDGVLRRLMRNCGRRGRSRNLMLAPNLLPKAVPHNGSRLLLGFIVRPERRLVESQPPLGHTPPWPSHPPERPGGPDAGDPRPVASLPQRARLLAVRMGAPAPLLPYVVLPRPTHRRVRALEPELRLLQRAFAEE